MPRSDGRRVVFFSHKWCPRDNAIVQRLIQYLARAGIDANSLLVDPVIPSRSIRATESARIDEADCFAVLWTPEAAASQGVGREVERQRDSGKPVILLRYLDTPIPGWWDPDSAYLSITSKMLTPGGPDARPIWPGLIDYAFGAKDIGREIGRHLVRFLGRPGRPSA